jgi:putative toxin-antitoxin system antitoxin component (TIGR02293 family)
MRRSTHLSPRESEKTERLARAFATALHVWTSNEEARAFMHAPHPMLRDRAPIDVAFRVECSAGRGVAVTVVLRSLHVSAGTAGLPASRTSK